MAVEGEFADADVVQTSDTTWRLYYATQPEVVGNNFARFIRLLRVTEKPGPKKVELEKQWQPSRKLSSSKMGATGCTFSQPVSLKAPFLKMV